MAQRIISDVVQLKLRTVEARLPIIDPTSWNSMGGVVQDVLPCHCRTHIRLECHMQDDGQCCEQAASCHGPQLAWDIPICLLASAPPCPMPVPKRCTVVYWPARSLQTASLICQRWWHQMVRRPWALKPEVVVTQTFQTQRDRRNSLIYHRTDGKHHSLHNEEMASQAPISWGAVLHATSLLQKPIVDLCESASPATLSCEAVLEVGVLYRANMVLPDDAGLVPTFFGLAMKCCHCWTGSSHGIDAIHTFHSDALASQTRWRCSWGSVKIQLCRYGQRSPLLGQLQEHGRTGDVVYPHWKLKASVVSLLVLF